MNYERTYWENSPSSTTPLSAENLNKIETGISEASEAINKLIDDVNALCNSGGSATSGYGSVGVPEYWKSAVNKVIEKIHIAMETAGRNKSSFLFYTDAHWNYGAQISPVLLKELYQNTAINKTFFGGDIIHNEPTTDTLDDRTIMKYLWDWRKSIRDVPNHYSVIGNHDDGNATNNIFSSNYIYSYLFAPEENNNVVRGNDSYYYVDDNNEKTRYLFLDTGYEGLSSLSDSQKTFINEALIGTPSGWHIVVVAHIWYVPDYDQYNVRPIPIVGLSTTAEQIAAILDNYNARSGEFANCEATVEFCIGGHVHRDYVGTTTGGIPIIVCETDSWNIRSEFTYTKGTVTESAVSGVIADYDNNKVSVVRLGRGLSFEVDLASGEKTDTEDEEDSGEDGDDSNTETTPTYTNILDTVGYEVGRLNSSGLLKTDRTDRSSTGFIKAPTGSTLYFKNITTQTSDYGCTIAHYDSEQNFISGKAYIITSDDSSATWYEDGNIKSFTINESNVAFIRFCAVVIDDTSIITVNEPIE